MKLSIALATLALAAVPALAEGTAAQRAACTGDAFRLCAAQIPSVAGVTACLRRERDHLGLACRTAMDAADRGVQTASAKPGAVARD